MFTCQAPISNNLTSREQNRTEQSTVISLLYLFCDKKKSVKFATHCFLIFKIDFIFKANQSGVRMFYTFINHALLANHNPD